MLVVIDAVQLPHALGEITFQGFYQQVIMIGHQALGVTAPVETFAYLIQGFQKHLPIFISEENIASFIASRGYVIQGTWEFNP